MLPDLQLFADEDFCYLTTTGRVTGHPHTIEIWFALQDQKLYLLSGGGDKADWIKNALRTPTVRLKIKDHEFSGQAHLARNPEEDALARKLLFDKYTPRTTDDLQDWSRTSLPLIIDLESASSSEVGA